MSTRRSGTGGFSLIELMTAVAVAAILTILAYSSYMNAQRKGNRGAAEAFLATVAQQEQQYFIDNRGYVACAAPIVPATCALNLTVPNNVSTYYTVKTDTTTGPPPTFTATATPVAGTYQASDSAGTLTIDSTGNKTPAGVW